MFNKNINKVGSLKIAFFIIIFIISLSSLPLRRGHSLIFAPEPVAAQLYGQSLPYGDDQIPAIPSSSSSSSSSMMDLWWILVRLWTVLQGVYLMQLPFLVE
jgi:hypothetical protein